MDIGTKAIQVADALAETCRKIGEPLSDAQRTVIVGGLAVWVEKIYEAGIQSAVDDD